MAEQQTSQLEEKSSQFALEVLSTSGPLELA